MEEAQDNNLKSLVSFGGAYSNHLLALACLGNLKNFKTIGFIRGEEIRDLNPLEQQMEAYGMQLIRVSREAFKSPEKLVADYSIDINNSLIIPMGGAGENGIKGCFDIVEELNNEYDHIFISSGTGTMALGMSEALKKDHKKTELIVFPSVLDNSVLDRLKKQSNIRLVVPQKKKKFGKVDIELKEFISDFKKQTNIELDTIYNGPCAFKMIKMFEMENCGKSLLLHCGGVFS